MQNITGRFAPSPSGRMHLGNIFTAMMSWLSVKSRGGKWILRIEDLDPQRSKIEYARLIENDLLWLGLTWDEGGLDNSGPNPPYLQSLCSEIYEDALSRLHKTGLTYPCHCSRADIMATQAPHQSDGRIVYSGKCRPDYLPVTHPFPEKGIATVRIFAEDADIEFNDLICGPQKINLKEFCGDFILRRKDLAWSYMLAVVIDDDRMGVTEVMRGNDLLLSTAQQIYLYQLLKSTPPQFAHLPLICNSDGIRLSKRDKALNMESLRLNFSPEEIIGLLAFKGGLLNKPEKISLSQLLPYFSIEKINRNPVIQISDKDLWQK